jgi:hypothetical protein
LNFARVPCVRSRRASIASRTRTASAHRKRAESFNNRKSTLGALVTHAREVDRGLDCA